MSSKVIAQHDTVVVTGAAGYIGAAIVQHLLAAGYHVRATTRSLDKSAPLQQRFDKAFGPGHLEFVEVKDMSADGAYDKALHGAAGLVHVAGDVDFGTDAKKTVDSTRKATFSLLAAAQRAGTIKRIVFTGSRIAHFHAQPGDDYTVDPNKYLESFEKGAFDWPEDHPAKRAAVYAAGKIAVDRAAFEWVAKHKPSFAINVVLPDYVMGENINNANSTGAWLSQLIKGDKESPAYQFLASPSWYVDVHDTARVHLAALVEPDVENERLWALASPFSLNEILGIVRRAHPDMKVLDDQPGLDVKTKVFIDASRSLELLKRQGRPGWVSLEESVLANVQSSL